MELIKLRTKIDEIDAQLTELILKRMEVSKEVSKYKYVRNLPVYDQVRERQKLYDIALSVGGEYSRVTDTLFSLMFDLSRSVQNQTICGESPQKKAIQDAISGTDTQFPARPLVACQGVEGAYSQIACERIFPSGNIMYLKSFDRVFSAVEQGLCKYGILPLENSTAGSVGQIYDLMMEHDFYIIRSCRVKVDHSLLAKLNTSIGDIREIISHEQAIAQCQDFIKTLKEVKITTCENTAEAARTVSESERSDIAALSSRTCAALYGLECLTNSVQDKDNNYTRFICISKELQIYPGANRTSLMMVLPNRCGSLYHVLSRLYALKINLIKLESRPLSNSDFEFMFYFDLDTSVYSNEFLQIFDDLKGAVTTLKYLGSYTELV